MVQKIWEVKKRKRLILLISLLLKKARATLVKEEMESAGQVKKSI